MKQHPPRLSHATRAVRRAAILVSLTFVLCPFSYVLGEDGLKKVSMMYHWIPQSQFAGYMVAQDKGFYREAGMDLDLLCGGPGKDCLASVGGGKITFCTSWLSSAIEKRADGVPLVNIGQIVQTSALLIVAMRNSGIREPKDLNGKKLGFWTGEFNVPLIAFLTKHDLKLTVIPNYTTVTIFREGAVDAFAAMWYNEYHTILDSGFNPDELTVFRLGDLGVDFPEDGLYCMEETFRADPELCRAFVAASLKGWLYAFDHEDEALDIVMKYAQATATGTNRAHQRWMLRRMKDLIIPRGHRNELGKLDHEAYMRVAEALQSMHLLSRLPQFDEFYRGSR